jgi:hypothetical protein
MYDEKPRRDPLSVLPDPPDLCQTAGCDKKADIQFLQVRAGDRMRTGVASEFCLERKTPKDGLILKTDYFFHCWIARCDECYSRELRGANKHQLRNLDERQYEQKASEYRGQLAAILKQIMDRKKVAA